MIKRPFTTILWDVDGTLLDFMYSQTHALTKCFKSIGIDITEEQLTRYNEINNDYWNRLELGEITKEELLPGRFTTLFAEYGITGVDIKAFLAEYQLGLGTFFSCQDDSLTICKALQTQVKQYVITNGVSTSQRMKLKLSGLADVMLDMFISEEVEAHKPSKEYFDYCLERIEEKDRSKILIVGDSLTSDIKGGILAGIPTCWYRPDGTENHTEYKPDYEISDLHYIYDILEIF